MTDQRRLDSLNMSGAASAGWVETLARFLAEHAGETGFRRFTSPRGPPASQPGAVDGARIRVAIPAERFRDAARRYGVSTFVDRFQDTHTMDLLRHHCWLLNREHPDGRTEWKLRARVAEGHDSDPVRWVDVRGTEQQILDVLQALNEEHPFIGDPKASLDELFPRLVLTLPTARVKISEDVWFDAVGWMLWAPAQAAYVGGAYAVCSYNDSDGARRQVTTIGINLETSTAAASKVGGVLHYFSLLYVCLGSWFSWLFLSEVFSLFLLSDERCVAYRTSGYVSTGVQRCASRRTDPRRNDRKL